MTVASESPKMGFPELERRICAIRLRERWPGVVRVPPIHTRRRVNRCGCVIGCPKNERPEIASSRLLRDGHRLAVDFLEYRVTAALEKRLAHFIAEPLRVIPVARLTQDNGPVGVSHHALQMNLPVVYFGECANRNLASAA